MLDLLDRYHGQATGIFTGDEHLAGRSRSREPSSAPSSSAMYSLENLSRSPATRVWATAWRRIAYNASRPPSRPTWGAPVRPAGQPGRLQDLRSDGVWTTNGPDANIFGLEPNFGCCTANLHQGWPKLVEHLWMKTPDDGLAAVAYGPCVVTTKVKGVGSVVEVKTEYPFRGPRGLSVAPPVRSASRSPCGFRAGCRRPR